ncbi:radical SAM/SPASM domain-containing protein [Vallitalea guaymasensis]|uniref:radical SAM/SPASM domain-containing protein n=1 Tax=Vallitalea guaymasensis TaxID=1185412 RepID=UPI000DE32375|nr:radical SAM protein [Vallitalea guaymasensis]
MIPALENLFIYLTWDCNLNCKHCWLDKNERSSKLSIKMLNKAIEQAIELGLNYIKISGGEPLIEKEKVISIIEKASSNNIKISIETNGTKIDRQWVDVFSKNSVSVGISIDSYNASIHDHFRGKVNSFNKSIKAVELLKNKGVDVGIIHSISMYDERELKKMVAFAENYNVSYLKINPIVKIGNARHYQNEKDDFIFTISPEEMLEIKNKFSSNNKHAKVPVNIMLPVGLTNIRGIITNSSSTFSYANCPTLNLISILPSGDLGLCAEANRTSDLIFGNLFHDDIVDVWKNSDTLKEIRTLIPDKLEGVCGNCLVKNICKGSCRTIALSSFGSINSANPICQKLYDENKFHLAPKCR